MVTSPRIEEYAFKGKCRWFVQWFGVGTAGTVECPAGGFILLRQILYRPFIQEGAGRNKSAYVHQLTLNEQGATDELQYIFRDPTNVVNDANHQPANSLEQIETWAVYKRNICIDLINAPEASTFAYALGAQYGPDAQERPTPLGFGTTPVGVPIQNVVNLGAGEIYHAAGEKRPMAGIPYAGAGVRDRLRFNVDAASAIQPVTATPNFDFQYPIIGLGMWIFNIPVSEYLNQ